MLSLNFAARTDVGLGSKTRNEDSGYASEHLLVLADGMGGHAGGDLASSIVVGHLVPLDGDASGGDDMLALLAEGVAEANAALHDTVAELPELEGMGTTLVAMLRSGTKVAMATIGDSRAYLVRDGRLRQISTDHSFVQRLLDEGKITEDEALHHPQRPLVTRVLTGRPDDVPDLSVRELRRGDRYILCSDGLTDYVAPDTLRELATAPGTPDEVADSLIKLALRASTRDNVTVIVAEAVPSMESPRSVPEVVGAAAQRGSATPSVPVTAAEKAAALARSTTPAQTDYVEDYFWDGTSPLLAEEETRSTAVRWLRRLGVLVIIAAVFVGAFLAADYWLSRQYFVARSGERVAVYQGVKQDLGPWELHRVHEETDVEYRLLPSYLRDKVDAGMEAGTRDDAERVVNDLREAARACVGNHPTILVTGCLR